MILRNLVVPVLGAVIACFVATCHQGCKPVEGPSVADQYTMEHQACVAKAKTLEESRRCREKVDCKFGVCHTFPDMCYPGQCN